MLSVSVPTSATPLATGAEIPMDVQRDEEVETAGAMEISTPTLDELASEVANSATPTPIPIYSKIVSSPTPTPIPIYSMVLSVPQVPPSPTPIPTITNCNAIFHNHVIISYEFGQDRHPSLAAQQEALEQSTMSTQAPVSIPTVAPTPPFKVHLDPADMDFLKIKSEECKARQKNTLLSEGQSNPYVKIIAALEQALREGSATPLIKPLQTQLQAHRERRMVVRIQRTDVIVPPRHSSSLSPTPSAGSPAMATLSSPVHWTVPHSVLVSSPVPALRGQTQQAPLAGSPPVLSLQLETAEGDPFAQEIRTMSTSTVVATPESMSREHRKEPMEVTFQLEVKETKRRGRPRKEQKISGRSQHEDDLPTRRRDDSDSTGEGEGKANDGKSRPGNGNGTGKHGSDREPSKTGTSRALIPKGQNSCSNAMARKAPTVKSVARRVSPF